jgi:hypothetical protein
MNWLAPPALPAGGGCKVIKIYGFTDFELNASGNESLRIHSAVLKQI